MKKNMGNMDRIIRASAAIVIAILLLTGQIEGIVGITLGILAIAFLGTGIVSFCPLYIAFGISTRKN